MAETATPKLSCTAEFFATTWKKYDADGNGYIEDKELISFLTDLAKKEDMGEIDIKSLKSKFLNKYDKNQDGKIDMIELAEVLNPEENFLFLIRTEGGPDSVEFLKIWIKYDADSNGFIDAKELKNFLRDAYDSCGKPISDSKIEEYTTAALDLYDKDDNHRLDFNEMIKLLPLATNYLTGLQCDQLTEKDFRDIFAHYDKNNDQSIEGAELDKLLGDVLRKDGKTANDKTVGEFKKNIMQHCDKNKDGKIQFNELALLLNCSK